MERVRKIKIDFHSEKNKYIYAFYNPGSKSFFQILIK